MRENDPLKLTHRKPFAHKGDSGRVLVIGGSKQYVGAVALAGIAALRAGCDVVTIAAPEKVAWAVNCLYPDLITVKLRGDYIRHKHLNDIIPLLDQSDVILLGNGIGINNDTKKFCNALMRTYQHKQKVIDADAIKLLQLQEIQNAIITPHAREFDILLHNSHATEKTLSSVINSNVILKKGPTDAIISKNKTKKITGGNPGLAKAGTGDVLAGLCAGFLAQSHDLFESACAASQLSKEIGNILLRKKKGYSFIASDMVEEIEKHESNLKVIL